MYEGKEVRTEYDALYRKRLRGIFLDFFTDVIKANLTEDHTPLNRIYAFVEAWIAIHFPFPFHDPECKVCAEIDQYQKEKKEYEDKEKCV